MLNRQQILDKVEEVMRSVGIDPDWSKRFGHEFSGGQRQRLALARALASDPPVLLLDESTSALDPVMESRLMDQLLAHRRGKTTVLVSHRPNVILRADWIVFMERGRVRHQDAPAALKESVLVSPYLAAA